MIEIERKLEYYKKKCVQLEKTLSGLKDQKLSALSPRKDGEHLFEQIQQIMETVPEGLILLNSEKQIGLTNLAAKRYLPLLTGRKTGEALDTLGGRSIEEFLESSMEPIQSKEIEIHEPEEKLFKVESRPMRKHDGISGWVLILQDITEERQIQKNVETQERLASIGQLAGGIAHDFNNILTVILGYNELLSKCLIDNLQLKRYVREIEKAADRAISLIRQLLVFSKKQFLKPRVVNINAIVLEFDQMLRKIIGEDIELETVLEKDLGNIKADPAQIEQVIMNLVVNSRDAMPKGGQLLIETANVKFDVPNPRQDGDYAPPGDYVTITVTDTGSGIEDKDLLHIFDPFFTTKEKGKGTGLGLSTVYGIVKQSGGHIWVSSNKNQGTTFRIYFPVVHDLLDPLDRYISMDTNYHGTETILFVEDEDNLRKLASHVLSKNGYKILEAQSGEKAYEISREYTGKIDLMITDIVMTGMSGYELVELLQKERNSMKIMYISGYLDSTAIKHDLLKNGHAMLQKPFSMDYLASFIREMLDQPEGA